MNELVREWIEKAEGDARTAEREACVTDGPNWDAVCFHAQQAVEKYLKAVLQKEGIPSSKTHDLAILAGLLRPTYPEWATWSDSLRKVSLYATAFRYPGETASKEDAIQALEIMRQWRTRLRLSLEISDGA